MAKRKLSRKELLKSPDEFLTFSEKVWEYLRGHTRQLWIGLIGLAAVLVIYIGLWGYLRHIDRQGQAAYNEASALLSADGRPEADPAALEKAQDLFQKLIDDYSWSAAADLALPHIGYLKAVSGHCDEAIGYYHTFDEAVDDRPPYSSLSALAIAVCLEEKKEFKAGIATLDPIVQNENDPFREPALYHQARLYALDEQAEKARELFRLFADTYPTSPFKPVAENRS